MLSDERITEGHFIKHCAKHFGPYQEGLHVLYEKLSAQPTEESQMMIPEDMQPVNEERSFQDVVSETGAECNSTMHSSQIPTQSQRSGIEEFKRLLDDHQRTVAEACASIPPGDPKWSRLILCQKQCQVQMQRILADDIELATTASEQMQPYADAPEGMGIKRLKRAEERGRNKS